MKKKELEQQIEALKEDIRKISKMYEEKLVKKDNDIKELLFTMYYEFRDVE